MVIESSDEDQNKVHWVNSLGNKSVYGTIQEFWQEADQGGIEILFCPKRS